MAKKPALKEMRLYDTSEYCGVVKICQASEYKKIR